LPAEKRRHSNPVPACIHRYTTAIAPKLFEYPPEHVLAANYLMSDFQPDFIADLLDRILDIDQMRVMLCAPSFADREGYTAEKWYGTMQKQVPMTPEQIARFAPPECDPSFKLKLPVPNPFIAQDFSLSQASGGNLCPYMVITAL